MSLALPEPPPALGLDREVLLRPHTYVRIGGPAAYFATPPNLDAVRQIAAWAREVGLPVRVIGGGSNMLVADAGVRAVVLSLRHACGAIDFAEYEVHAGAAVMLPALARAAAERNLGGLEFAIGIPGSVGGALQTNAGTGDGRCIGPLVRAVEVLRADGEIATLPAEAIRFDYRRSSLRESGEVVLGATLALVPRDGDAVRAEMRALLEMRQRTQPTAQPNVGSVFRNPPNDAAGRLIEAAGCKGFAVGRAHVSEKHANFIVHDGNATAAEYVAVMTEVQARVLAQFGVRLTPEVEWWGDGDTPEVFRPA